MPGPNILLFVTNKISRTDSKFLICFSPSKMSALNYAERILLPANLFPFPVQNHPQNIVGGCLQRFISGFLNHWRNTHTDTHTFPPSFGASKRKWIALVKCVYDAFPVLKAETSISHQTGKRVFRYHPGLASCFMNAVPPCVQVERAVAVCCDLRGAGSSACPKIAPQLPVEFRHSVRKTLVQMKGHFQNANP